MKISREVLAGKVLDTPEHKAVAHENGDPAKKTNLEIRDAATDSAVSNVTAHCGELTL